MVLAPRYADAVGVYVITAATFDVSVSMGFLTMNGKFMGAAAAGTKVVFAPRHADAVGVNNIAAYDIVG